MVPGIRFLSNHREELPVSAHGSPVPAPPCSLGLGGLAETCTPGGPLREDKEGPRVSRRRGEAGGQCGWSLLSS